MPTALVLRSPGTNCDAELCRAFEMAGATPTRLHIDRLLADPARLEAFDILGFPGGFSYGDDIASGRIFAMRLREHLYPALRAAAVRGCPMIGVCNGFQVLVQVGLLPGPASAAGSGGGAPEAEWPADAAPEQTLSLAHNAAGRFIDRWVRVEANPASHCIWTRGLVEHQSAPDAHHTMLLPIAHGEGRLVAKSPEVLAALEANNQIALRYLDNPNGSAADAAGICDASGRIFGLMPHPERYLDWTLHPFWTRLSPQTRRGDTPGLTIFRNAVEAAHQVRA